jgi:hypothetical protein
MIMGNILVLKKMIMGKVRHKTKDDTLISESTTHARTLCLTISLPPSLPHTHTYTQAHTSTHKHTHRAHATKEKGNISNISQGTGQCWVQREGALERQRVS